MSYNADLCLVVPCYNEEKRLPISQFSKFLEETKNHVLFVNDGSLDSTLNILEDISTRFDNAHVLDLEKNGGKAEAVRRGFLHVQSLGDFQWVGFWDADLATPLSEVDNFLKVSALEEYNILMGSRILRLGGTIERSLKRHLLGRVFATVASNILRLPVYDTQCGAKLFRSHLIEPLFSEKFISYWVFDVELLFRYRDFVGRHNYGQKIYELPLARWKDIAGSKLHPLDFLKAPMELLKMCLKYGV